MGQTPLHLACKAGEIDAVAVLLASGADIEAKNCVRVLVGSLVTVSCDAFAWIRTTEHPYIEHVEEDK